MDFKYFLENIRFYGDHVLMLLGYVLGFNIFNWLFFGSILNLLGIRPRHLTGLIGIPLAPILHANLSHFLSNSFPLIFLSLMMIAIDGLQAYYELCIAITLLSGLMIWLFARHAIHIGASALATGMYGWLAITTYYYPSAVNYLIMFVLFFYFGFMIQGVLPNGDRSVSWEGHLFGMISGIIVHFYENNILEFLSKFNIF